MAILKLQSYDKPQFKTRPQMNTTSFLQKVVLIQYQREQKKFARSLNQLETTQTTKLKKILNFLKAFNPALADIKNYQQFANAFQPTQYSNWKTWIDDVRRDSQHPFTKHCSRFEPTSGSTNAIKWIPYSKPFLKELNLAAATWLADTFLQYPKVLKGKHYWSLSWVPHELRASHNSNDIDLFPIWQRLFLSQIMAVPEQVKLAPHQDACWFATLVYLASCEELSLISIWSPTFLIQALNDILKQKKAIIFTLKTGVWAKFKNDLNSVSCPQSETQALKLENWREELSAFEIEKLWPDLALISCWDSSTAKSWAKELKKIFPKIPIQGKGLWATEGVVTIPYKSKNVLALRSHFYEFRCLESSRILPSWEIEVGMLVQPIITSSSGLLRYELPDKLQVVDFIDSAPCLRFLNRLNSIDLVGEKIDFDTAQSLIQDINNRFRVHAVCLIADKHAQPKPKYELLLEGDCENIDVIEQYLEQKLCANYHYQLSRSLGQLESSQVLKTQDALAILKSLQKSSIAGNNKIEPIVLR
jgi:hypothetical protein